MLSFKFPVDCCFIFNVTASFHYYKILKDFIVTIAILEVIYERAAVGTSKKWNYVL